MEEFCKYKAKSLGKNISFIDPRYTSQKCNCCECIDKKNRIREKFECISCGHSDHADLNAAKNIRDIYLKCGSFSKEKQQSRKGRVQSITQSSRKELRCSTENNIHLNVVFSPGTSSEPSALSS